MTQITEDYVSFETAKLLKERGFNEECRAFYVKSKECGIELFPVERNHNYNDDIYPRTSAPTLQMAMKWLRKVHEIFISLNTSFLYPIRYHCEIFCYGDNLKTQQDVITENFESPEEACEAAIKYCLENLI